jgi:predicted ATPase/DNA-binding CsgD family transcriptional regulator
MSQREAEVLEAVGRHLSNAQIASRLHISVRTVESHVSSLLRKLGVADRRELAELAPRAERPALRADDGTVTGLPTALTSFIGREEEQASVLAALAGSRMVSLVGPGGVGKTRLATEMAETIAGGYQFGGVFVDLVPVRDGFLTQAVAALLGVTERPGRSLDAALHEFLGRGRSLLVLDNCEHLVTVVAAFVEKLLADCAGLTILATSRERLAIPGERTVIVPPLSLAAGEGGAAPSQAAALFMDRARASDPGFEATPTVVREVCTCLDGVPLAIELAAARSASLGVDGLLAGLDDHLRLLAGSRGPQERHRSLRAVIDWSHDLLSEEERALFRRVGVFIGGFDLDAAMAVGPGGDRAAVVDLIGRLADKSLLIHRRGQGGSRWQMLETIRAYALYWLADSGEEDAVRDAYLGWADETASELEGRIKTGQNWRDAFDAVADDLRAACRHDPRPEVAEVSHRLARALGHLTYARRFIDESREHYEAAAARAGDWDEAAHDLRTAADAALAAALNAQAFDLLLASAERAKDAGNDSATTIALAYAATIADRFPANFPKEVPQERLHALLDEAVVTCPANDPVSLAYVLAARAWTEHPEKTVPDRALADEALQAAELTGDPVLISGALDAMVNVLDANGWVREAHQMNQKRAELLDRLPRDDPHAGTEIVDTYYMLTSIAFTAGDLPGAVSRGREALDDELAGGRRFIALSRLIQPLVLQARFGEADTWGADMWEAWMRAGRPPADQMVPAAYCMVLAGGLRGDDDGRRRWLDRAYELIGDGAEQVTGTSLEAAAAFTQARICLHQGRIGGAVDAVAWLRPEEEDWYDAPRWHSMRAYAWAVAAEVAVVAGLPGAASRLAAAAPAGKENYWAAACLARARGRLTGDRGELDRALAGWERIEARFERACTLLLMDDRADEGRAELTALGCQPPAD